MELKQLFRQQKNDKFHPSWILIIVALTILIGSVVWIIAWLVPYLDGKPDHSPSSSPSGPKVILVSNSRSTA